MQVDRTYIRPLVEEGDSLLLVGRGFPKPYDYVDADRYGSEIDEEFERDARARMTARFPRLHGMTFQHGRVGLYSITPDWHPLLGPVEQVAGLHLATGGSGHCFKLGPAIGELVAGEILGNPVSYADIHDFRLERFADGDVFRSTYGGNRA
jgi:glycine/D-amino acid oxidase-like deaminating enzyme